MPFTLIPGMIRGETLTATRLNQLRENMRWLRRAFALEHTLGGVHANFRIPRLVFNIAGTTKTGDPNGWVTSISRSGSVLKFRLPRSIFPTAPLGRAHECRVGIHITPWQTVEATLKPISAFSSYEQYDATYGEATVQCRQLSSSLGSGNAWTDAAAGARFSFAVYVDSVPTELPQYFARPSAGQVVTNAASGLNGLISEINELRAAMLVEHGTTGTHFGESDSFPDTVAMVSYASGYTASKTWGASLGSIDDSSEGAALWTDSGDAGNNLAMFIGDIAVAANAWDDYYAQAHIWNGLDLDAAGAFGAIRFAFNGTNWYRGGSSGTTHGGFVVSRHIL